MRLLTSAFFLAVPVMVSAIALKKRALTDGKITTYDFTATVPEMPSCLDDLSADWAAFSQQVTINPTHDEINATNPVEIVNMKDITDDYKVDGVGLVVQASAACGNFTLTVAKPNEEPIELAVATVYDVNTDTVACIFTTDEALDVNVQSIEPFFTDTSNVDGVVISTSDLVVPAVDDCVIQTYFTYNVVPAFQNAPLTAWNPEHNNWPAYTDTPDDMFDVTADHQDVFHNAVKVVVEDGDYDITLLHFNSEEAADVTDYTNGRLRSITYTVDTHPENCAPEMTVKVLVDDTEVEGLTLTGNTSELVHYGDDSPMNLGGVVNLLESNLTVVASFVNSSNCSVRADFGFVPLYLYNTEALQDAVTFNEYDATCEELIFYSIYIPTPAMPGFVYAIDSVQNDTFQNIEIVNVAQSDDGVLVKAIGIEYYANVRANATMACPHMPSIVVEKDGESISDQFNFTTADTCMFSDLEDDVNVPTELSEMIDLSESTLSIYLNLSEADGADAECEYYVRVKLFNLLPVVDAPANFDIETNESDDQLITCDSFSDYFIEEVGPNPHMRAHNFVAQVGSGNGTESYELFNIDTNENSEVNKIHGLDYSVVAIGDCDPEGFTMVVYNDDEEEVVQLGYNSTSVDNSCLGDENTYMEFYYDFNDGEDHWDLSASALHFELVKANADFDDSACTYYAHFVINDEEPETSSLTSSDVTTPGASSTSTSTQTSTPTTGQLNAGNTVSDGAWKNSVLASVFAGLLALFA